MSDVFKERLEKIKQRNLKVKHEKHKTWPIEKKIEVVSQWLVLGNLKMVSATTGVQYSLVRQWKSQPWWKELEMEIRQTQNIEMDTKLSKIVDKSLDAVMDRIDNGEWIFDSKSGQIKRKPASLRDVARVSVDMLSKRELLRGNATERKETTQISVTEQLKMLAAEFAKWQRKELPMVEVLDVDVKEINAEYEGMVEQAGESGEDESLSSEMETEESGLQEEATGYPEEASGPTKET